MKFLSALIASALVSAVAFAGEVEIAGMKSKTPDSWKEEKTSSEMRMAQFKLPKADGDSEDAELIIFYFRGGSGDPAANLKRQLAKFKPAEGKDKVEEKVDKIKVGKMDAPYQDITGTYLKKDRPFDPSAKAVEKKDYRQLYVILITDSGDYYPTLVGPAKTIEKHKKDFDNWLKNFK
jgi:hypothetical protein